MSNLVHNEKLKLTAAFCNNCGVAAFVAGAIVPVVSLSYLRPPLIQSVLLFFLGSVCALILRMFCHWLGLRYLEKLKD